MPTIPEVRVTLTNIADAMRQSHDVEMALLAPTLDQAIKDLHRRSAPRKAPKKIPPLTDAQKSTVRAMARDFPEMSQLEIADHFGTNPGRVSEALRGKRQ